MTIVGTAYTKFDVQRTGQLKGKIDIKNNAAITSVEKQDITLGTTKQSALKFGFSFKVTYEPEIAHILLEGEILWVDTKENVEDCMKSWKKDKTLPPSVISPILNAVLQKSNVEALILSRELNLPSPIPLPKVDVGPQTDAKKEEKKK